MARRKGEKNSRAILFDLDDTLVDSGTIKRRIFRTALEECSIEQEQTVEDFMRMSGVPLFQLCERLKLPKEVPLTYRKLAVEAISGIKPFPSMELMLNNLAEMDIPMGIVTSRDRENSMLILESTGLDRYFGALVTPDDINSSKPMPGPLYYACGLLSATVENSVYVGDSVADMNSAKAAGMIGVGSTWSGNSEDVLLRAGASTLAHTVEELMKTLLGLLKHSGRS